jgi:hypothetical protein
MPKARRKPGAGPIPPVRHPDDEFPVGYRWEPDAEDEFAAAACQLLDNDARPLVRALLHYRLLPQSVRQTCMAWLGEFKLSPEDQAAWDAACAYRQERTAGVPAKSAKLRAKRVLDTQPSEQPGRWRKLGVEEKTVLRIINEDGSQWLRIRSWKDAVSEQRGEPVPRRKQYPF